ncbi:uncharacterized protein LOC142239916 [Haematobia irritans]|uniref:uncharacterized protein LOC142239916 n=1 Tax=Haematobia irritans TaxID=7368 RepID=UPI003F4FAF08
MWKQIICILFVSQYFQSIEMARRLFNLVVSNVTCQKFGTLVKRFDCDFEKIATNKYAINANFFLGRALNRNSEIHAQVCFTPQGSSRSIKFFDIRLNICDMLTTVMGNPFTKGLLDEMRRSSNIPYDCPIKGNYLYSFSNYSLTTQTLPTYTPLMKFNFTLG